MSSTLKKFNGKAMANQQHYHVTVKDLLEYADTAGLIDSAHGGKKTATLKWKNAVIDLYGPTGCLRGFAPHQSKDQDRAWSKLKTNVLQLLTSLNQLYSDKMEHGGTPPLAIEEKGHLLFNKWETSLEAYKRLEAEAKQAQASNRAQCRTANQEQGLVHGAIPIMSPPTMTRPNQSSSANSQSSGNTNSTSHSARSHPNSRPPALSTYKCRDKQCWESATL